MKSLATDLTIWLALALLLIFMVPGIVLTRWVARLCGYDIDREAWVGRRDVTC